MQPVDPFHPQATSFIGFGEAAQAFLKGWKAEKAEVSPRAYDIKTDSADPAIRVAKQADCAALGATGCETPAGALAGASYIFSLVTADRAHEAARAAAAALSQGALYLDCNSCAPGTKVKSAQIIEAAGGRYVDVAVMAPVHPLLHHTPLLVAGPHADAILPVLARLGMKARLAEGPVGAASAIKMTRSVMMKGLEALMLECVLAGRKAGVDGIVLDSLEQTYPGFGWREKAAYMMERVMTHGIRRAAEMREVAITVSDLGLDNGMTRATVEWQQRVGDLKLKAADIGEDHGARADAILERLGLGR